MVPHFFAFSPNSARRRSFKMALRLLMADTVRFNFRAIKVLSIFELSAQPVDATQALNLSAGVSNCKVSRGRSFS